MKKYVERFAVGIPVSLAIVNLAAVVHSLWRGDSLLINTVGTCVAVASAWFIYLTRNYYGALTRRLDLEQEIMQKMTQLVPEAALAQMGASNEVKH